MSKVGSWSTTAGNNNATPPDGWPEGQAPSTVNDCAREMMASIRTMIATPDWIDIGSSPSYLSSTAFSLGTANTVDFVVGRRIKLFDATTLYGTIYGVSGTHVDVRLDSGAITGQLSSVALGVLSPAVNSVPDSVMGRRNIIINGQFDVWQRGGSFNGIGNGITYTADRFFMNMNSDGTVLVSRDSRSSSAGAVPTLAQAGVFMTNSMHVEVQNTDTVVAANDYAVIQQRIEGIIWRRVAHKPLCLSFWAHTNRTGIYCVAVQNDNGSASYVANYTLSAANTWTRFTIPFAAAPTDPYTWNYGGGTGLIVSWTLMGGSSHQSNPNEWTATNAVCTSSQVDFMDVAGNTFRLAGVQLEEGIAATPLEPTPLLMEYDIVKRYYEADNVTRFYYSNAAFQDDRVSIQFSVQKRAAPTMTIIPGVENNVFQVEAINSTTGKFDMRVIASNTGPVSEDGAEWRADSEL